MNIPYGKQSISDEDIKAVVNVLKSDWLTQGPMVPKFEADMAKITRAKHAVAVNSATSALHLAVLALGLGPGDILWTSPITFVASANCAAYCGANVDFVDIDKETFNMSPTHLQEKLKLADAAGKLPKVLVPVHMAGNSAQMKEISDIARHYGVKIVEDASHAIGGNYSGYPVGACKYSDVTIFSFHPVKIITTGEGGVATTNDTELAARMQLTRSHGIIKNLPAEELEAYGSWYYEMTQLGFNYRMTDIAAALGVSQLNRIRDFVTKRNTLANKYNQSLNTSRLLLPKVDKGTLSTFHLYIIRLVDKMKRKDVFNLLKEKGIGVNVHYIPVHLQPYYRRLGFSEGDFPCAEDYYSRAISIPLFPQMTAFEQETIISCLNSAVSK
jgi:UDP-4-amino-4,6-dideoxy-N-acetyl-beta-L-altrosamine transaminase